MKKLALLILAVVAIEVTLQLTLSDYIMLNKIVPNKLTHHDYRPGARFINTPSAGDSFSAALTEVNSFGIRGPEIGRKDRRRIILLGDSFVQGDEVAFKDTFGQLASSESVEYIAHGISSWSPTTEFSWLIHKGMILEPDAVYLFLCVNDFYRVGGDADYRAQIDKSHKYSLPFEPLKTIGRNTALGSLGYHCYKKAQWFRKVELPTDMHLLSTSFALWSDPLFLNVINTTLVVTQMQEYLSTQGVPLKVYLVPLGFAWKDENVIGKRSYGWHDSYTVSQEGLSSVLSNAPLDYIDLFRAFDKAKKRDGVLLFNEADGHWNTNGHKLMAEIL